MFRTSGNLSSGTEKNDPASLASGLMRELPAVTRIRVSAACPTVTVAKVNPLTT